MFELEALIAIGQETEPPHAAILKHFNAVRAVLDRVTASADLAQLKAVTKLEGTKHRDAYTACHSIVMDDDGHADLLEVASEAASLHPGGKDGTRVCTQKPYQISTLYLHARDILPDFVACMQSVVAQFDEHRTAKGGAAVQLHTSPLKHLYRIMEKMCWKAGTQRYRADTVFDMVRCIIECSDCALMAEVLQALLESDSIVVRRVKDRATEATRAGWMDVMMNVTLAADVESHVCEVQIVHSKMMVVRAALGGHTSYAKLRAASEMLEVREHDNIAEGGGRAFHAHRKSRTEAAGVQPSNRRSSYDQSTVAAEADVAHSMIV